MRKTREILRLKLELGYTHREVANSLKVSVGAVAQALARASAARLTWPDVASVSDEVLEARLYGPRTPVSSERPPPDPVWIHQERKKPGVTLALLHLEYLEQHPNGYGYTAFCDRYRKWLAQQGLSMRQIHRAGDKLFVDYSGKKPSIVDPKTGEVRAVELFVAVLGASSYTYAEATLTQRSRDWIGSHCRAFEFFGGVPRALVCDQLKSGVIVPCRYEPLAQRTYQEMARHYDTAVLPARPRKPRDKAAVEVGVQVVQRWILARLRNEIFYSLSALNRRIRELLVELNARSMRRYAGVSRRELFEQLDRPALRPLAPERFVYAQWKTAKANIDYHIAFEKHLYSVPYLLSRQSVEVRATDTTVEIFHKGKRVASHARSWVAGGYTTVPEHMPKSHRAHLEWTPSRLLAWAAKIGPHTEAMVRRLLQGRRHPEQGYRSCLGVLRLYKRYGRERLDAACERALRVGARSSRHVASILQHGLDRVRDSDEHEEPNPVEHDNVRGPDYYH